VTTARLRSSLTGLSMRCRALFLVVWIALATVPLPLLGQADTNRILVTFIVKERFSTSGLAAVVRKSVEDGEPFVVAVERRSLNTATIGQSLLSLMQLRNLPVNNRLGFIEIRIPEATRSARIDTGAVAVEVLKTLRRTPRSSHPKFGDAQWFTREIQVPEKRRESR